MFKVILDAVKVVMKRLEEEESSTLSYKDILLGNSTDIDRLVNELNSLFKK